MTQVREFKTKEIFEAFNLKASWTLFLQSWNYGEICRKMGEEVLRLGLFENKKIVGIAQVIITRAKRGTYLFCPYGPVFTSWKIEYFSVLLSYLKKVALAKKAQFIRISPFLENTLKNKKFFENLKFVNAPMHVLAETTWLLDLSKTEDELLREMRKTTRNLIRRAEKEKIEVKAGTGDSAVQEFIKLHAETKMKHKFTPYPDNFFRNQTRIFREDNQILVFNAYFKENIVSSAIVMFYGKMAAYHHGANSIRFQKIPASYLVQWQAIKEAKRRGLAFYNFWGVSPDPKKPHPISGVSLFKRGFGGYQHELLHCQDLPLSPLYFANWIIETGRRFKRGYYYPKPS